MRQKISMVTLGVSDIVRSTRFYESLGWRKSGESKSGEITFFDMGGVVFGLYPRAELAKDATIEPTGDGFSGVTISHNAIDEAEVDAIMELAVKCGARVVKPAQKVFWGGYSGYFADPDGYLMEVAYNPYWKLDTDGNVELPA